MSEGNPLLTPPDCDAFISNVWHEMGRCNSGMNGLEKLSYLEVGAYSDHVCELSPFDVAMIVKMSQIYVSEQSLATKDKARICDMENSAEHYHKIKAFKQAEISKKMRQLSATANKR